MRWCPQAKLIVAVREGEVKRSGTHEIDENGRSTQRWLTCKKLVGRTLCSFYSWDLKFKFRWNALRYRSVDRTSRERIARIDAKVGSD
jgi:hypothetical protein